MRGMGLGDWVGAPTAALVNDICFDVIENGVVVGIGGRRTYFASVLDSVGHISAKLEEAKKEAREERERQAAEREKYAKRAADPLGGLGDPALIEKLMGMAAAATGLPEDTLRQALRERLGVDSWRAGEPPVS